MKLAIVITSLEVGGAEKMVLDLIEKLQKQIEIQVFIIRKNHASIYDKKLSKLKIKYHYLNARNPIFSIKAAKSLRTLLDEFRPDIIHTHLKAADYIYYYRKRQNYFQWIHTLHTLASIDLKKIRRIFYRKLYIKQIIIPVAVSPEVEKSLSLLFGIKGIVIPNGIDLNKFKYIKSEKELFKIIHIGRFTPVKNHQYIVSEYSKFSKEKKDSRLILIGDGPLRGKIVNLTRKLGISRRVNFIKSTNKPHEYLEAASVFVLPSKYEGMSLALLEALASGLLVVVSRGLSDLIEDEVNGFEIDLKENALYYKLQDLYENYRILESVRENASQTAKDYSILNMAENYLKLYKRVLDD